MTKQEDYLDPKSLLVRKGMMLALIIYTLLSYHCIIVHKQINGCTLDNMHWQQDVASCHYANRNIPYLGGHLVTTFLQKGPTGKNWPAHSPDLNIMDFCIWGWLL